VALFRRLLAGPGPRPDPVAAVECEGDGDTDTDGARSESTNGGGGAPGSISPENSESTSRGGYISSKSLHNPCAIPAIAR
jgi:hypothetical protein